MRVAVRSPEIVAHDAVAPTFLGSDRLLNLFEKRYIKWALTREEELFIIPKYRYGQEISHAVLSSGEPVLAAGEAEIAGRNGKYLMLQISNRSGHFLPTKASIELGKKFFRRQGIDVTKSKLLFHE